MIPMPSAGEEVEEVGREGGGGREGGRGEGREGGREKCKFREGQNSCKFIYITHAHVLCIKSNLHMLTHSELR